MLGRVGVMAVLGALGLGSSGSGIAISSAKASRQADALLLAAANPGPYAGHTSQHQRITFTIASGKVTKLGFWIVIACKSHHSYRLRASGFAPIPIRSGRFHATVSSTQPVASATVTGRVRSGRVAGGLSVRRYVASEHGTCAGSATYTAGH